MIIMKFGGTSVEDAAAIDRAACIVRERLPEKPVVVVSALAKVTDQLLAMARAAGEVAPLMITGVVKLAPALPIDGFWPFLHLERKFMHLGFHIYDVGFQSPNVDAARPMVFTTAMLLLLIVIILNLTAITLRNRLRKKYAMSAV